MPLVSLTQTPVDDWPWPAFVLFIGLYLLLGTATILGLGIGAMRLASPFAGQWQQQTAWLRQSHPDGRDCLLSPVKAEITLRCLRTTLVD
jgi:hypothetical protein